MDVYVVRVYRYPQEHDREMIGFVEIIGENNSIMKFATMNELMEIFVHDCRRQRLLDQEHSMSDSGTSPREKREVSGKSARKLHEGPP